MIERATETDMNSLKTLSDFVAISKKNISWLAPAPNSMWHHSHRLFKTYMHARVSHAASTPVCSKKSCFCRLRKLSVFSISLSPKPSAVMLHGSEIVSFVETCRGVSPDSGKWEVIGSVWKMASASHIFSSLHANSPRHNLSLEISGERRGAGAVQMVQLQLLRFCKLLGGKASMVRLQGVGELVKQTTDTFKCHSKWLYNVNLYTHVWSQFV